MQKPARRAPFFALTVAPLQQCRDEATGGPTADPWQAGRAIGRLVAACLCAILATAGIGCATLEPLAPKANIGHAGFLAASTVDVISTQKALNAGAQELNPLMGTNPSPAKMTAVKMVGWSVLRTLENTVESEIGRNLRWYEQVFFWAIPTALTAWVSARNFDVAAQYSRRD